MKSPIRFFAVLLAVAAVLGALPGQASAHGWGGRGWGYGRGWGFGIGIGLAPAFVPGPYYYPPPVYYAPPAPPPGYYSPYPGYIAQIPASQAPAQNSSATAAQSCNAGSYVCPMEISVPVGARCYCRGNDGERVYGSAQ